jgi:hypothetical protein
MHQHIDAKGATLMSTDAIRRAIHNVRLEQALESEVHLRAFAGRSSVSSMTLEEVLAGLPSAA